MATKKTKVQFVDKSYKLTRGVAPLSYMLPTKHTKRFALLHFDEETGTNLDMLEIKTLLSWMSKIKMYY